MSAAANIFLTFVVALVIHEVGHLIAARVCRVPVTQAGFGWGPELCSVRAYNVDYFVRLVPAGAYIRMDMAGLQKRPFSQQLVVLFAGIAVNIIFSILAWGTLFGAFNLALAIGNLLPVYQQDGWKMGMIICRKAFGRPSPLVEWSLTISGALVGISLLVRALINL